MEVVDIRVKMRTEIDVNSPINLKKLSPINKIKVGFITQWRQTNFYKNKISREEERKLAEQNARDNLVKEGILSQLYSELIQNKELGKRDEKCREIVLQIPYEYSENVKRVIQHKDFIPYDISIVPEVADMRRAFSNMPLLIRAKTRSL